MPLRRKNCTSNVEFDAYASNYAAGMENPLKALLGDGADQYIQVKLRWLLRRFPCLRTAGPGMRILDYGCGAATLLRLMAEAGVRASLTGCDVSKGMLNEAAHRWPERLRSAKPALRFQRGPKTPFHDREFNLVVISAVLHHVPPGDRPSVYAELCRVTQAGGHVVVFEHNPLNPMTRFVVSRTPIDRDAALLKPGDVAHGLAVAGATDVHTRYLMFTPPRTQGLDFLEAALCWLPMGAQYAVTATAR